MSEPGQNVLMSIIVYPDFINVSESFKLQFLAAMACVEVLTPLVPQNELSVKWPNDILVDQRKIAGVLIRNIFMGNVIRNSVIGFGLNVNQTDFSEVPAAATSLKRITGQDFSVEDIRKKLYQKFRSLYQLLENGKSLKEVYLMMLYGYGEEFSYFDLTDQSYKRGEIVDVQGSGHLLVRAGEEVERYDFKEIKFLMDD